MAFTRVLGPGIHTEADVNIRNLEVTGNLSVGGTITYDDVSNVDSIGVITARSGIQGIGIQSGGVNVAVGVLTALNFIGAGNTFKVSGTTVDICIQGGGGSGGGKFTTSTTGIQTTSQIVGIGTTSTDDADLQGVGSTARGVYVSNGMFLNDSSLNGNHYIGTAFNGLMVGPVNINDTLSIDGNYVVV